MGSQESAHSYITSAEWSGHIIAICNQLGSLCLVAMAPRSSEYSHVRWKHVIWWWRNLEKPGDACRQLSIIDCEQSVLT